MVDLAFTVVDARPEPYAASPTMALVLDVAERTGASVDAIALRCQIRIETTRRRYSMEEGDKLVDLFGERDRWADTMQPIQLGFVDRMVPGFRDRTEVVLPLPFTYDLEVAASKYVHSLDGGEIPLVLFFSGTVFCRGPQGLAVHQVPWHLEARHRLPVATWRAMVDAYFPGQGWLRVRTETLDALRHFATAEVLTSWDDVIGRLLENARSRP